MQLRAFYLGGEGVVVGSVIDATGRSLTVMNVLSGSFLNLFFHAYDFLNGLRRRFSSEFESGLSRRFSSAFFDSSTGTGSHIGLIFDRSWLVEGCNLCGIGHRIDNSNESNEKEETAF